MRRHGFPLRIVALFALLWFSVGCGSEEDPAGEWGSFLVGTWRLTSVSSLGQDIACPGEIELEEGIFFGCGEMTIVFRLDGTFRADGFRDNSYSREEGIWRVIDNAPILEMRERGSSDAGPVEDEYMEEIEPPLIVTLQRSGGSLWMIEMTPVPITAVFERI